MQTRSQTNSFNPPLLDAEVDDKYCKKQKYEVNIDFNEASELWKANKKSIGNGSYTYICLQKTKQGKTCKREALPSCDYCNMHRNV